MALWIRGIPLRTQGTEIIKTTDWEQITVTAATSGISISTSRDEVANRVGMPVPVGAQLIFIAPPNSSVYAAGDDGSIIGVCSQPLPWSSDMLDAIAISLGLKDAREVYFED